MGHNLKTVARFAEPTEAHIVKNLLADAGIRSFLEGEMLVGVFWWLGNAVGGIKLQVAEEDYAKTCEILAAAPLAGADSRSETAADETAVEPMSAEQSDSDDDEPAETDEEACVRRAWYAAVIGMVLLPPILSIYSLWLLLRHGLLFPDQSGRFRIRAYLALACDAVGLLLAQQFLQMFLAT